MSKTAKNHVSHLINDAGNQVSDSEALKSLAPTFYKQLFNHTDFWNVFPKLVAKKRLTPEAATWMDRPISDTQIYTALSDNHPDKAQVLMATMQCSFRKIGN